MSKEVPFKIDYVDNLAQGVSKLTDKITLLPKTLPGEEGYAHINHAKAKINFAQVKSLSKTSSHRQEPSCPHFNECNGCHYLHTNYEMEAQLKHESYSRLFRPLSPTEEINYIQAENRLHYRNRIQLHYDLKAKTLGYKNGTNIVEASECQVASLPIQKKLTELYHGQQWSKLQLNRQQGHIELYEQEGHVNVHVNKSYAHGGFTQVNEEMNQKMINLVQGYVPPNAKFVVDLFGGQGNLSRHLNCETLVIDHFHADQTPCLHPHQRFMNQNLYDKAAPAKLKQHLKKQNASQVDWLIIDPPRSGLKNIDQFIEVLNPAEITYVSCHPQTQIRDISKLVHRYETVKISLLDLFPSTFHLESIVHLKLKK